MEGLETDDYRRRLIELAKEESSDLTIQCGDEKYQAHKEVLCMQSEFFNNATRERTFTDNGRTIVLQDTKPEIAQAMLQFFYVKDQPQVPSWYLFERSAMEFYLDLFALANFIQCAPLKAKAGDDFVKAMKKGWEDFAAFARVAEKVYDLEGEKTNGFAELRQHVAAHVAKFAGNLLTGENPVTKLMDSSSVFSRDVAAAVKTLSIPKRFYPGYNTPIHCLICTNQFFLPKERADDVWCPNACLTDFGHRAYLVRGFVPKVVHACVLDPTHTFEAPETDYNPSYPGCMFCHSPASQPDP